MKQANIILLKSRRTGYSSISLNMFKWQKEYLKSIRVSDRRKIIERIFNI